MVVESVTKEERMRERRVLSWVTLRLWVHVLNQNPNPNKMQTNLIGVVIFDLQGVESKRVIRFRPPLLTVG